MTTEVGSGTYHRQRPVDPEIADRGACVSAEARVDELIGWMAAVLDAVHRWDLAGGRRTDPGAAE